MKYYYNPTRISNNLINLREKHDYTMKQVYTSCKIEKKRYSGLENGFSHLTLEDAIKLCNFYKIEIAQLL